MAAGLLPETRLEVPVVAHQHQWDKPAGVWLYHMPGNAHGHSWGCLQGEGEGLASTEVCHIPLNLTGQVSAYKTAALTVSFVSPACFPSR